MASHSAGRFVRLFRLAVRFALFSLVASFGGPLHADASVPADDRPTTRPAERRRTPLHAAAYFGDKEEAQFLLSRSADVNARDVDGTTPLMIAAAGASKPFVEFLLAHGADVNARNDRRETALTFAIARKDAAMVRALIAGGADLTAKGRGELAPLHEAARMRGGEAMVAELLHAGAPVDARDVDGRTPLHWAVREGNEAAAKILVANGADRNAQDNAGDLPRDLADEKDRLAAAVVKEEELKLEAVLRNKPRSIRQAEETLIGHWEGNILGRSPLRIKLDITTQNDLYAGTAEVPAWGDKPFVVRDFHFAWRPIPDDHEVAFSIVGGPLGDQYFKGQTTEGGAIVGRHEVAGRQYPLHLKRGVLNDAGPAIPVPPPQTPRPPYPYDEREIAFESGHTKLAGALMLPKGDGPHPAVLLLNDGEASDRDGSVLPGDQGMLYRVMADRLARAGIAVLRMDARGVGGSGGELEVASIDDLADDALAAVERLRTFKGIDAGRIGLVGWRQGGVVAALAASRSKHVAAVVLLGSDLRPGVEVALEVFRKRLDDLKARRANVAEIEKAKEQLRLERRIDQSALRADDGQALLEAMFPWIEKDFKRARFMDQIESRIHWAMQPRNRMFLHHDPRESLIKLTAPVFALNAAPDENVVADWNAMRIFKPLSDAGNADATVKTLGGYDASFRKVRRTVDKTYEPVEKDQMIDPAVLDRVAEWINRPLTKVLRPGTFPS